MWAILLHPIMMASASKKFRKLISKHVVSLNYLLVSSHFIKHPYAALGMYTTTLLTDRIGIFLTLSISDHCLSSVSDGSSIWRQHWLDWLGPSRTPHPGLGAPAPRHQTHSPSRTCRDTCTERQNWDTTFRTNHSASGPWFNHVPVSQFNPLPSQGKYDNEFGI